MPRAPTGFQWQLRCLYYCTEYHPASPRCLQRRESWSVWRCLCSPPFLHSRPPASSSREPPCLHAGYRMLAAGACQGLPVHICGADRTQQACSLHRRHAAAAEDTCLAHLCRLLASVPAGTLRNGTCPATPNSCPSTLGVWELSFCSWPSSSTLVSSAFAAAAADQLADGFRHNSIRA